MNTCKNPFQVATYKKVFQDILGFSEITNKDECLAEMNEPMGKKISVLPGHGVHRTSQCKAFVTTTTNDRLLVAIFDLYGKFYTYYEMNLCDMRNLMVKKAFGGIKLSFGGKTQLGWTSMEMYIPKHDFGSDLKEQKIHLQRLIGNLQAEYPNNSEKQVKEASSNNMTSTDATNQKVNVKENITPPVEDKTIETEINAQSNNPLKARFDIIYLLAEALEENGIDTFKFPKGIKIEKVNEWELANDATLPKSYKDFLMLVNGFKSESSIVYSLEQVTMLTVPDEFVGYYAIGEYIGDGSLLLTDGKGNFYYGDHVNGIEPSTFEDFIDNWIINCMKDSFIDNGIEMPD